MSKHLRHYQSDAKGRVLEEWQSVPSTLVVLPTGCGKTVLFAAIIEACQPHRSLVLAHREELIWQARDKIERFAKLDCEIEMADLYANINNLFNKAPVVISTVQTQGSKRGDRTRMSRFKPDDFGRSVFDECFPAGTLVDGKPIEQVKCGDVIRTHCGFGTVTHCFKRQVLDICVITFQSGQTLVCTPDHPVWTGRGFVGARNLIQNDMVLTITTNERMLHLHDSNTDAQDDMLRPEVRVSTQSHDHATNTEETRRSDYQLQENQWHEQAGGPGQGFDKTKGDGVEAANQTRQRPRTDSSRTGPLCSARVGVQRRCENEYGTQLLISDLLQTAHRKYTSKDWGGS